MRKFAAALVLLFSATLASAQAYTTITAADVLVDNGSGTAVNPPAGTNLCFTGVNNVGATITYTPSGGSPVTGPVCQTLTSGGALTGALQVANASTASPVGLYYTITVVNGTTTYLTIPIVSVSGTVFGYDSYALGVGKSAQGIGYAHLACNQGAAWTSTTLPPGLNNQTCSASGSWTSYPPANYCPYGQAYLIPQQGGTPMCVVPTLSSTGAPSGSCVEHTLYLQIDATPGQNLYACVNGAYVQQAGSGGSMTWPSAAGLAVYSGSSSWASSLKLGTLTDGDFCTYTTVDGLKCTSTAGSGNVSNSGTPAANQYGIWVDATHIKGQTGVPYPDLTGTPPTWNQSTTGNAATASALAATPSQCTSGQFATGVAASGNANCGTPAGTGNVNGPASALDGDAAVYDGTTGKLIKDAGFKPAAAPGNQTDEATSFTAACTGAAYNAPSTNAGAITLTGPASCSTGGSFSMMNHSSFAVTLTAGAVGFGTGSPSSLAANQSTSCIYNGTVLNCSVPSSGSVSPLTTKGDLYGFSTGNARIPVGADGTQLQADSTQPLGVKWASPSTGANLSNSVYVSPNCGSLPNCFAVHDDGQKAQFATYPVVSGGATMTLATPTANDTGVEWGHVTAGPQAFTFPFSLDVQAAAIGALFKEASAGSGTLGTCWATNDTSGSTVTVSVSPTGGSGHNLVVFTRSGTPTTISFTDGLTQTWHNALGAVVPQLTFPTPANYKSNPIAQIGYIEGVTGGTYNVVAHFGVSATSVSVTACEVSGLATSSTLDAASGTPDLGTPVSVLTTATTNDFAFIAASYGSVTGTYSAGANGSAIHVTTSGTDPVFAAGDVGKTIVAASQLAGGNGLQAYVQSLFSGTTIASYVGPNDITLSAAPRAASLAGPYGQTGTFIWGTKDGAQVRAAWNAALATDAKTLWLPCGTLMIEEQPFPYSGNGEMTNPNINGCITGSDGTVLVPTLDFDYAGASGALIYYYPFSGKGTAGTNAQNPFLWSELSNFTILGGGVDGYAVTRALPIISTNMTKLYNVAINGWNWDNGAGANNMPAIYGVGLSLYDVSTWGGGDGTLYIAGNDIASGIPSTCFSSWIGTQNGDGGPSPQSPSAGLLMNTSGSGENGTQFTSIGCSFNPSGVGVSTSTSSGAVINGGQWHSYGDTIGSIYATSGTIWVNSYTRLLNSKGITNAGATIYARDAQIDKLTQTSGAFYDLGGNVACLPLSQEYPCGASDTEDPWYKDVSLAAVTGGTFRGQGMADFTFSAAGTPLPTCSAIYLDATATVSDATTPTYLGTYTSGGTVHARVRCDGTNWVTE